MKKKLFIVSLVLSMCFSMLSIVNVQAKETIREDHYVNPIYKENSVGADNKNQSPDIEHFFPKSIYPFLSLSISNLLPSCTFCNKIKSDVDTYKHNCLSPYEVKNSDFKFDFSLELNQVKKVKLTSKPDCKNSEILHLESLYNEVHSKYKSFLNRIKDVDIDSIMEAYYGDIESTIKYTDENDELKTIYF